jgi:NhaP-type Na+/H+ or K+/H+ antiporter
MIELHDQFPLAALSESRTLFEVGLIIVLAAAAPADRPGAEGALDSALAGVGLRGRSDRAARSRRAARRDRGLAVVSISVGVIVFDSGLGLKRSDLQGAGAVARVYRRLVTLGIFVTWAVGTVASYLLFDLSWEVALVLGAVLVVSGPTVVGPLVGFIRPSKTVGSVLKWEGTLADPMGATLGVVVYHGVLAGHATAGGEILGFLFNFLLNVHRRIVVAAHSRHLRTFAQDGAPAWRKARPYRSAARPRLCAIGLAL